MRCLGHLFALLLCTTVALAAIPVQKCELCHGKPGFQKKLDSGQIISLYVPPDSISASVHKKRECNDCHRDVNEIPHKPGLQRVDCTGCHYIGNLAGAPELAIYEQYRESVHGRAAIAGNKNAPICQDCHGAHNVHKPRSEDSPLSRRNIPASCGRCHVTVYGQFSTSIHGKLLAQGMPTSPLARIATANTLLKIRKIPVPASSPRAFPKPAENAIPLRTSSRSMAFLPNRLKPILKVSTVSPRRSDPRKRLTAPPATGPMISCRPPTQIRGCIRPTSRRLAGNAIRKPTPTGHAGKST
jgi:hypothetical protein